MAWSTLLGAGPWAAFLAGCAAVVWFFATDRVVTVKAYNRREKEWEQRYERDIAAERRISEYAEKRAEQEAARADRAAEALATLSTQLPEALRQAKAGQT